ncbi:hypothetical protein ACQJBY_042964 [Aegilops geniculata]
MVAAPPATPQQQPQGGGRRGNYRGGGHKQQRWANPALPAVDLQNQPVDGCHPCVLDAGSPASSPVHPWAPSGEPPGVPHCARHRALRRPYPPCITGHDATPAPPYGGFNPPQVPPPWDPSLLTVLHSTPSPSNYGGGGDWYMDLGATAHMKSHPVTNLVSVRRLARENPITVEFDDVGFSVKDARTRMVPSLPAQLLAPPAAWLAPAITYGRPPPSPSSALAPCPAPSGLAAPSSGASGEAS